MRNVNLLKSNVSEIHVKEIPINQGVDVFMAMNRINGELDASGASMMVLE